VTSDVYRDLAALVQSEEIIVTLATMGVNEFPASMRGTVLDAIRGAVPVWQEQVANTLRLSLTEEEAAECIAYIQRPKPAGLAKVETALNLLSPLLGAHMQSAATKAVRC
jgi:4-hydroxy-3-methylbut-2-en-1-yl diphosphate synthase IspG/GcpE